MNIASLKPSESDPPTPRLILSHMGGTLTLNTRFKFWKRYENGFSGRYHPQGTLQKKLEKILGVVRVLNSSAAAGPGLAVRFERWLLDECKLGERHTHKDQNRDETDTWENEPIFHVVINPLGRGPKAE